jgi:hypothetical protein
LRSTVHNLAGMHLMVAFKDQNASVLSDVHEGKLSFKRGVPMFGATECFGFVTSHLNTTAELTVDVIEDENSIVWVGDYGDNALSGPREAEMRMMEARNKGLGGKAWRLAAVYEPLPNSGSKRKVEFAAGDNLIIRGEHVVLQMGEIQKSLSSLLAMKRTKGYRLASVALWQFQLPRVKA